MPGSRVARAWHRFSRQNTVSERRAAADLHGMRALACVLLLVSLAACGGSGERQGARPDLQDTLASLVHGASRAAPGATAYVAGPHGTWSGAAGWADVTNQVRMTPDARLRLESVSKLWTATVVLALARRARCTSTTPSSAGSPESFRTASASRFGSS